MRVTHGPSSEGEHYADEEIRVFDAKDALQAIKEALEDKEEVVGKQLAAVLEAKFEKNHLYQQYAAELLIISVEKAALEILADQLVANPRAYQDISLVGEAVTASVEAAVASLEKKSFFSEEEIESALKIAFKKIGQDIEVARRLTDPLDNQMEVHQTLRNPLITPEAEGKYRADKNRLNTLNQVQSALYELGGKQDSQATHVVMKEIVRDAMDSEGRVAILKQVEIRVRETLNPENWSGYPEVLIPAHRVRNGVRRMIH